MQRLPIKAADEAFQVLLSGGKHQQGFGTQTDLGGGVEQNFAQCLSGRRASRFARKQYGQLVFLKPCFHYGEVGGFAFAVYAVKGNKSGFHMDIVNLKAV